MAETEDKSNEAFPTSQPSDEKKFHLTYLLFPLVVILLTLAIAYPELKIHYYRKQFEECRKNLGTIENAKCQWAIQTQATATDTPSVNDLLSGGHLKEFPKCPAGGIYTIGPMSKDPGCSLSTRSYHPHDFRCTGAPP